MGIFSDWDPFHYNVHSVCLCQGCIVGYRAHISERSSSRSIPNSILGHLDTTHMIVLDLRDDDEPHCRFTLEISALLPVSDIFLPAVSENNDINVLIRGRLAAIALLAEVCENTMGLTTNVITLPPSERFRELQRDVTQDSFKVGKLTCTVFCGWNTRRSRTTAFLPAGSGPM